MPIAVASMRAEMAQEYANRALYASLHTGDPGETGDNEDTAVTRLPVTWNVGGSDGEILSDPLVFPIATATFETHIGLWDDPTAGNFRDSLQIDADLPVGDYTIALAYTQT